MIIVGIGSGSGSGTGNWRFPLILASHLIGGEWLNRQLKGGLGCGFRLCTVYVVHSGVERNGTVGDS